MTVRVVAEAVTTVAMLPQALTMLSAGVFALKLVPVIVMAAPPAKEEVSVPAAVNAGRSIATSLAESVENVGYPFAEFSR